MQPGSTVELWEVYRHATDLRRLFSKCQRRLWCGMLLNMRTSSFLLPWHGCTLGRYTQAALYNVGLHYPALRHPMPVRRHNPGRGSQPGWGHLCAGSIVAWPCTASAAWLAGWLQLRWLAAATLAVLCTLRGSLQNPHLAGRSHCHASGLPVR